MDISGCRPSGGESVDYDDAGDDEDKGDYADVVVLVGDPVAIAVLSDGVDPVDEV